MSFDSDEDFIAKENWKAGYKEGKAEFKICYFCEHFYMGNAEPDLSDDTPGCDWSMRCWKNKWSFDAYDDNREKFAKCLATAQTCSCYTARTCSCNKKRGESNNVNQ